MRTVAQAMAACLTLALWAANQGTFAGTEAAQDNLLAALGTSPPSVALRLTEEGILPRPRPRLIDEIDFQKAPIQLGLEPYKVRNDGRITHWSLPSGQSRLESVRIRAQRLPTAMKARETFLDPLRSNAVRTFAVGTYMGNGPPGVAESAPAGTPSFRLEAPAAGEVCNVGSDGYFGFVRNNYVIEIFANPVIEGENQHPDEVTGQKVRELAKKIDEYLLKAPGQEIEDQWLPRIEAVSVELPSPVVGRPFRLDARVSLHGKPCPTGRMEIGWLLFVKKGLPRELHGARSKTYPGPTSVEYTVDKPGWWWLQCKRFLRRQPHGYARGAALRGPGA